MPFSVAILLVIQAAIVAFEATFPPCFADFFLMDVELTLALLTGFCWFPTSSPRCHFLTERLVLCPPSRTGVLCLDRQLSCPRGAKQTDLLAAVSGALSCCPFPALLTAVSFFELSDVHPFLVDGLNSVSPLYSLFSSSIIRSGVCVEKYCRH